jgi:hypothetical protein
MSQDDDMAILFYKRGDAVDLAEKVVTVLASPELQEEMSLHNYEAGVHMTMANVARTYLRWFELHKLKRQVGQGRLAGRLWRRIANSFSRGDGNLPAVPDDEDEREAGSVTPIRGPLAAKSTKIATPALASTPFKSKSPVNVDTYRDHAG